MELCNTILSLNSITPSILATLPPFPNCHLITFPPLRLCHLTILAPFPPCYLTPLIHLSHLPSSQLSYLSQLTSLPTTNRYLQNSNLLSLGRQDKQVWLIVRQPLMKAGWWDAPLALCDLAEAIINRNIYTPLCLKSETSELAQLAITLLHTLLANILTWYQ